MEGSCRLQKNGSISLDEEIHNLAIMVLLISGASEETVNDVKASLSVKCT